MYNEDKFEKVNAAISEHDPIEITSELTNNGIFVAGKFGSGRTTMLQNIARSIIGNEEKHPVVVIDPYGDIVKGIAGCIPDNKIDDVILIDFHDRDWVVPCNPLDVRSSGLSPEEAADAIMDIGPALWSSCWGPNMQKPLRMALIAIAAHNGSIGTDDPADGPSLVGVFLNGTKEGREKYISEIKESETKRDLIAYFSEFNNLDEKKREQYILPVLSKSYLFEENPMIEFFSSPGNNINFEDIIKNNKILLVNTGIQYFGKGLSDFLGSFVINAFLMASKKSKDNPSYLIIDDFSNCFTIEWKGLIPIFESDYDIHPVLGTKSIVPVLSDFPEEAPGAISRSFGTLINLPVEDADAEYLAECEYSNISPQSILSLLPCECFIRSNTGDIQARSVSDVVFSETTYDNVLLRRKNYSQKYEYAEKNIYMYLEQVKKYSFVKRNLSEISFSIV